MNWGFVMAVITDPVHSGTSTNLTNAASNKEVDGQQDASF